MSYIEGWDQVPPFPPGPDYGTQGALGAFDIAAMQALYGTVAHNAGDDTYTLPTANAPGTGWSSIWDTGGNDTISNAGSNLACTIDLRAAPLTGAHAGGYVSFVHGVQGGFTIANGTTIENAVGGGGDDTLIGGSDPNVAYTFTGGGGNDRIIGGAGNQNTAIFTGPQSDYSWSENHDGSWTITDNRPGSPDGTDTLENIQDLKFADGIFVLPLTGPSIAIYPIEGNDTLTADDRQGPLIIDGNASVAGQVTVTFNGKSYIGNVDINNGWSVTVPTADLTAAALPAGTYAVSAGIQDQIGNSAQTTDQLTVLPPSIEYVSSGQTASGHVISGADEQIVLSGGIAVATTVTGGGLVDVQSGGAASGTVVAGGGLAVVERGGAASGATVGSGGTRRCSTAARCGQRRQQRTVNFDIAGSAAFGGTLTGGGTLVVSGGGHLDVVSAYTGAAQIDDTSTLEFTSTYVGVATFSGAPTGPGGTLKLDAPSTGPITVVNPNDTVIAQPGGNNWINAAVSYTLPANIDALFLYAGSQGTGNSDAAGDALYALDAGNAQTLTGNSANDTFVVYNSSDVVVPKAGSHDVVYAAASYTLPTGVDTLILEGGATQGVGNSDAAGDGLYAANPGQVATLTGNSANDTFVVYNSSDVVVPKTGSHDVVYSAVNYTLPTGVDVLILEAGTQAVGNSDAAGDALYAANAGLVQTLTGNSANDTFVVYNSADVVVPKAGSHDIVYSAVNYTLPTGVDSLILEAGTQAIGNSDAAGDTLYAANAGIAQTLTGHSHNDTFVVYNSGDTVIGQAGSTDTVYAAANFTLPTNVDTLFLEGNASAWHRQQRCQSMRCTAMPAWPARWWPAAAPILLYVAGTAGTIMTGGAGHDTFAFPNVMGHDEVTNFGIAKDTLQFNATLFSNFTAAMNHASQSGANTVFTIDANDTVTLDNVTKTSLTAGNFHFS